MVNMCNAAAARAMNERATEIRAQLRESFRGTFPPGTPDAVIDKLISDYAELMARNIRDPEDGYVITDCLYP